MPKVDEDRIFRQIFETIQEEKNKRKAKNFIVHDETILEIEDAPSLVKNGIAYDQYGRIIDKSVE